MENLTELVKTLRERTGVGIMDCRKALVETNGDLEKAIDILRQKGIAKAAKKADRETSEGRIGSKVASDRKKAALVKLTCETDFVAKNDMFINLAEKIADLALAHSTDDVNKLLSLKFEGSKGTVEEEIKEAIGKIGENIQLKESVLFNSDKGYLELYTHLGSKLVVMVEITSDKPAVDELTKLAHELAMQIAIDNPEFVSRDQVPSDVVHHEREVIKSSPELASKPDAVKDKIVEGKLGSFFGGCCLVELPYMRDGSKKVKEIIEDTERKIGGKIHVTSFKRIAIGK